MTDTLPLPGGVNISMGSSMKEKARVRKASFGNGYTQRSGDGLNVVTAEYNIRFENLRPAEADTLINFLRSKKGYQAFNYTPPREGSPRLWTCEEWSREHVDGTVDSVVCTFQEVFVP